MYYDLLILGLASMRLTVLISMEAGPFGVLSRIRSLAPHWLGCSSCASVTIGLALWVAYVLLQVPTMHICHVLALSQIGSFWLFRPRHPPGPHPGHFPRPAHPVPNVPPIPPPPPG